MLGVMSLATPSTADAGRYVSTPYVSGGREGGGGGGVIKATSLPNQGCDPEHPCSTHSQTKELIYSLQILSCPKIAEERKCQPHKLWCRLGRCC